MIHIMLYNICCIIKYKVGFHLGDPKHSISYKMIHIVLYNRIEAMNTSFLIFSFSP